MEKWRIRKTGGWGYLNWVFFNQVLEVFGRGNGTNWVFDALCFSIIYLFMDECGEFWLKMKCVVNYSSCFDDYSYSCIELNMTFIVGFGLMGVYRCSGHYLIGCKEF